MWSFDLAGLEGMKIAFRASRANSVTDVVAADLHLWLLIYFKKGNL